MSTPSVSWNTPPLLAHNACESLHSGFRESQLKRTKYGRQAIAAWLLQMIGLQITTPGAVARALSSEHPFTALESLYIATCNRLARRLSRLVRQHALCVDKRWHNHLSAGLISSSNAGQPPAIGVMLECPIDISLPSLHKVRRQLGSLVHESLDLINSTLLAYRLPVELWEGGYTWSDDEAVDEYRTLRAAGGLGDLSATRVVFENGDFYYFHGDSSLESMLRFYQERLHGRPPWMRRLRGERPILRARQLQRSAKQYIREHGEHPWTSYVLHVTDSILAIHPSDEHLQRFNARKLQHLLDFEDAEMPAGYGLCVHSATRCEIEAAENLFQEFGNNGETLCDSYGLLRLAAPRLRSILEAFATAIGLLLRAGHIDKQVKTSR